MRRPWVDRRFFFSLAIVGAILFVNGCGSRYVVRPSPDEDCGPEVSLSAVPNEPPFSPDATIWETQTTSNTIPLPSSAALAFPETDFDFGIAGPEETLTHTFSFTNTASSPVEILHVESSCKCTAALLSSPVVPPAGTGEIRVTFQTGKYERKESSTVDVRYAVAAGEEQSTTLNLNALVRSLVAVDPQGVNFGRVARGQPISSRVRVLQLSDEPLAIKNIDANEEYVSVTISEFQEENSRGFVLDVSLSSTAPLGPIVEVITVHTNLKKRPKIDIPIWAEVLGNIRIEPEVLSLGSIPKGAPSRAKVYLYREDGKNFQVSKAEANAPFVSSLVKPAEDNGYEVGIVMNKLSPAGPFSGELTVFTDDPDQKVIHIPFRGVIRN